MSQRQRVLITGASGLVGTRLTSLLSARGHEVMHLSRSKRGKVKTFTWDVDKHLIEPGALQEADAIIHLAGANVAEKRWTTERKKELIDSRVQSAQLLYNELKKGNHHVRSFISASAVGYYGFENEQLTFDETSPGGNDFLATLTQQWEAQADNMKELGIRVAKLRVGVVLSKNDGALKPIVNTVKYLIGAPLGRGSQYISWVHHEDICNMFVYLLEHEELSGAFNGVADEPVTNKELTKAVAKQLNKPLIFPSVPSFGLRLAFGEMANIVLNGSKVSNRKIVDAGYQLKFPRLDVAIKDLLS